MDHLPSLLAAMYRAPQCSTLRGTVRYWTDHARRRERLQRERRGTSVILTVGGGAPPPSSTESTIAIWRDGDRLRVDQDSSVTITDPRERLQHHPGHGAIRTPVEQRNPFEHPNWLWAPRRLIDAIDIQTVELGERLGRPVWRVTGVADAADHFRTFMFMLDGDRYRFDVDHTTGAVLAMHVSLVSGEVLDDIEWTTFEPDAAIDDGVFELALAPGERIRSVNELRLEGLARDGVDISGIDPDDDEAVRQLLEGRLPWRSTLDPLAQVVPTGDPPDDEDAARAAIGAVIGDLGARDGDRLVNVQAGDGLAPYLDQARERFPAELRLQAAKFVSATEAVVIISVERSDGYNVVGPQTLRAVVEDRRWKAERSSFTSLLGMAGVRCPPPPER